MRRLETEYPVDPIDFSTPGDADTAVAIESCAEGHVQKANVEFSDGEIQSLRMRGAEARSKADRCFGSDGITETSKNGLSCRWTRMP